VVVGPAPRAYLQSVGPHLVAHEGGLSNAPRPASDDPGSSPFRMAAKLRLLPTTACPDGELVERIRCGDPDAFERVFRTYFAPLCTVVHGYVRSHAIAEEVVQDLLLTLWRRRGELEVRDTLRVYLFTAARHRALNVLRRVRREVAWARDVSVGARVPLGRVEGPQERLESRELAAAIDAAVATLPERRRLAFQLTQEARLSHAEAAAVMGITPKTVAIHLGLARQDLRARLAAFT
jgi:RNA polymerase sigma-70 factor (ECF subfamily)